MRLKAKDAIVVWRPATLDTRPTVRVVRKGSSWDRDGNEFWMPATALGEWGFSSAKDPKHLQLLAMFILFNTLVVRDRIPVPLAHEAFLNIDEYGKTISPDCPGANNEE